MRIPTPLGAVVVELKGSTLLRVKLAAEEEAVRRERSEDSMLEARLRRNLVRYFAGKRVSFLRYRVALGGLSMFTRQVLGAARRIPYGECRTYGDLARQIGRPRAARAVGQALRRNPAPIIIPCHRVVGKGGDLRGFSAGIDWKKRLLALEAAAKSGGRE